MTYSASPSGFVRIVRQSAFATLLLSCAATAQTFPASCDTGELATVPLTFTDDQRPLIDASINGHTVPAMLNLGSAQTTVLNKKTLDRFGVPVRQVTSTAYRDEKDGRGNVLPTDQVVVKEGMMAVLKDYSAARTEGKNMSFIVEDFIDDAFGARIGAGNLLQTDLELALDAGYLKYFKPDGCFREHLAYWDAKAVAVPIRVDVWKRDPRPVFSVLINGKETFALLSTATPHSYIPASAAARLGLTPTAPGATQEEPLPGHGRDKPVWNVPVEQMAVGGLAVKDFNLRLMDLPYSGELVVLGADFLHRYRVYIAMSQGQVYFSPIGTQTPKRGSVEVIPQPLDS